MSSIQNDQNFQQSQSKCDSAIWQLISFTIKINVGKWWGDFFFIFFLLTFRILNNCFTEIQGGKLWKLWVMWLIICSHAGPPQAHVSFTSEIKTHLRNKLFISLFFISEIILCSVNIRQHLLRLRRIIVKYIDTWVITVIHGCTTRYCGASDAFINIYDNYHKL